MQRALSTHLFANHRLTTVWLERIWNAGIPLVEIFCARQHLNYLDKGQISDLSYWFRESELKVHSLHSPMYTDEIWGRSGPQSVITITEPVKSKRIAMVDEIKRALEIAESIPFRYLIQHLGVAGEEFDERKVDAAFTVLEEIILFARHRGVEILLENTPNELSSAERLLTFIEMTHLELNVCLDVGHAHMHEGVENAYRLLKERIRSTHIHDNNGKEDLHLFPLYAPSIEELIVDQDESDRPRRPAMIDWPRAMDLLRSQPDQYPLLLELREVPGMEHPLDVVRETFDRLEALRPTHES